jgi:hypothetical protein
LFGFLKVRDNFGYLDVDGRIKLKCMLKIWDEGVEWIHLAQNRDQGRGVVETVGKGHFFH